MEYNLKFANGRSSCIHCMDNGTPLQDKINAEEKRFSSEVVKINGKPVKEHALGGFIIGALLGAGAVGLTKRKPGTKKVYIKIPSGSRKPKPKSNKPKLSTISKYLSTRDIVWVKSSEGKEYAGSDLLDGVHVKKEKFDEGGTTKKYKFPLPFMGIYNPNNEKYPYSVIDVEEREMIEMFKTKEEAEVLLEELLNERGYFFEGDDKKYSGGGHVSKGEMVWKKLTPAKRLEFLNENCTPAITPRTQQTLSGKSYNFLPKAVKIMVESYYADKEEYATGGITSDIEKTKKKLIAKAKSKGIYENFGQNEVRQLQDKYGPSRELADFEIWAMDYDGRVEYKTGGVSSNYKIIQDTDGEYEQGAYFVVDADTDSMLAYFDFKKEASDYLKKVKELGFRNVDPSEFNGQYASFMTDESMYKTGGKFAPGGVPKVYEVGIDEGNKGTRTIADFPTEKDARSFMYDYQLRNPKAKLFIDSVTTDFLNSQEKFAPGGYTGTDDRIKKMVEHWNKYGWASGSFDGDDSEFFEAIGKTAMSTPITSQTGSDIKYYDETRVDGQLKPIKFDIGGMSSEDARWETSFLYDVYQRLSDGEITIKDKELSEKESMEYIFDNITSLLHSNKEGYNPWDAVAIVEGEPLDEY